MKRVLLFLLLATAVFPAFCRELVVVATGDLHGELRRFAALAPVIRAQGRDALRIDLGDLATGNFAADHAAGFSMVEALNALNYDCFVPGNHDFEYGAPVLTGWRGAFRGRMLGAEWRTANWNPEPWSLFERGGVRCAVIGLSEPCMAQRTLPGDPFIFEEPESALARIMPQVRAAKPDVVILAWHRGMNSRNGRLHKSLRYYPGIDLVIGAHSHEENPGERIGGSYFVQSGCRAGAAIRVRLFVDDKTRKLRRIESELLRPEPDHPDAQIIAIADRYAVAARAAAAEQLLPRRGRCFTMPSAGESANEWLNLGAAAMLEAAGSDAVLYSLAVVRQRGDDPLTRAGLFRLLPYRNRLCVVTLTPDELRALLEEFRRRERNGRIVCVFRTARRLPERGSVTVAMTDYLLCSSEVLRPVLQTPARLRRTDKIEREIVADYLLRRKP